MPAVFEGELTRPLYHIYLYLSKSPPPYAHLFQIVVRSCGRGRGGGGSTPHSNINIPPAECFSLTALVGLYRPTG